MDLVKLGKTLKNKRDEFGFNLRDAGKLIGISHNYLSILEKAKDPRTGLPITPTIDTLKLISDAYKLDINKLLNLAGYDDIIIKRPNEPEYEIETLAAHHDGEEWTEEELEDIEKFKEFVKMRRKTENKK